MEKTIESVMAGLQALGYDAWVACDNYRETADYKGIWRS